ncbi:diacylglycerol kinase [Amycolatopsis sp. K13G38]|uniref:Diacylglycerol kinase n=1 Tax=Amycolatopsis acididurans TaxID=2724524 RepID=A0ABX1IXU9_9PSEU|nr:diacylglycerol kinase family protein [Amycolatopsis acididurans]NKQ52335.1 diacylglycerol kinase [Amycolatopsis acididurans]
MPGMQRPSPRRRICAAAALAAACGALAIGIGAVVRNPLEVVSAVLLIAIAVAAGWDALVRRGYRRWFAAALAVAALGATAALPDLRTFAVLSLVIGLVVVSAAATRVAVGQDLSVGPIAVEVPPARRGVLLMNPRSGGGKVATFGLEERARRADVEPVLLGPGDDLRALAEKAVADGADVLGMAGGDGSQAVVADVASRHGVAFVCVPAGTRNHFALDLGLDRADVAAALDAFGAAVERRVDLATLGDRVFVNNASLGVYATVVQSAGYRDAKVTTVARQLPELLGPDAKRPDLRFTRPDGTEQTSADIVLVSNGRYRLDHLSAFGSREHLDEGVLGVVTLTVDRATDIPALVSAEMTGQLSRFRGYRSWTTPQFVVRSARPLLDVGVDGEALRLPPPLVFGIRPAALRVRLPVTAPGAPPASVAPRGARQALLALLLVLSGEPAR